MFERLFRKAAAAAILNWRRRPILWAFSGFDIMFEAIERNERHCAHFDDLDLAGIDQLVDFRAAQAC